MTVRFHPHAKQRTVESGATEAEVLATLREGERCEAKYGRTGFRRDFAFEKQWHGMFYRAKQVEAYTVHEDQDWLVIFVIVRYF